MRGEGERSVVAHATVAALRCVPGLQDRHYHQRTVRRLCRLDHLRTVPATLRRACQELAACRHLRLDTVGEARTPRGRRMPGRARDLHIAERALCVIRDEIQG